VDDHLHGEAGVRRRHATQILELGLGLGREQAALERPAERDHDAALVAHRIPPGGGGELGEERVALAHRRPLGAARLGQERQATGAGARRGIDRRGLRRAGERLVQIVERLLRVGEAYRLGRDQPRGAAQEARLRRQGTCGDEARRLALRIGRPAGRRRERVARHLELLFQIVPFAVDRCAQRSRASGRRPAPWPAPPPTRPPRASRAPGERARTHARTRRSRARRGAPRRCRPPLASA